jgi:hypothetical protein
MNDFFDDHVKVIKVDVPPPVPASVYQALVAAGCEIDHHESDLYVRDTAEANEVLAQWPQDRIRGRHFIDNIEHVAWLEIPFAYDPHWESKR